MVEGSVSIKRENRKQLSCEVIFPENWDELTEKQFLFIAKNWNGWKQMIIRNEDLLQVRSLLVIELCGVTGRKNRKKLCDMLAFVDENTNTNILSCVDFVFNKLNLTKNHLPKLKIGWFNWFYGPGDRLNDLSIEEFSFAYSAYINYNRTLDVDQLNNLVAILYRPAASLKDKRNGETKQPFNYKLIEAYSQRMDWLSDAYKQGVLLFFMGCLEYFKKKYPEVFRRAEKNEVGGTGTFFDTVVDMSGGEFGPFKDTKSENMHVIMRALNKKIKNSKNKKTYKAHK